MFTPKLYAKTNRKFFYHRNFYFNLFRISDWTLSDFSSKFIMSFKHFAGR